MKNTQRFQFLSAVGLLVLALFITSCGKGGKPEGKTRTEDRGGDKSVEVAEGKGEEKSEKTEREQEAQKDYLSLSWARETIGMVNGLSSEEKNKRTVGATTINDEGMALYKKAEYVEAAKAYEKALDQYPTPAVYFNYANALYLIPRHGDSIRAFEISIGLGYEKPHYAYYNIACLYSLTNDSASSFDYLERAVEAGFKDFSHIGSDPDLAHLRSQSDWEERFARLQGLDDSEKYRAMIAGKTLSVGGGSVGVQYEFCKDGKATLSGTSNVIQYGTWKVTASHVVIRWTRADSLEGVGKPEAVGAAGPSYKEHKRVTHSIDKEETIDLANLNEHFIQLGFPQILNHVGDCTPKD
jgi:tetratricopeptide (TPR) repeat protein